MNDDLHTAARGLRRLAQDPYAIPIVEGLGDVWISTSRREMGHDTWQLDNRTQIVSVRGTKGSAVADLASDTPYAAVHNSGSRYQPGTRYWDKGMDAAEDTANQLEGKLKSQIELVIGSGGHPNPRSLF